MKLKSLFSIAIFFIASSQLSLAIAQNDAALLAARAEREANVNYPTRWWADEISSKTDAWYRSDEGLQMAENILSWQDDEGGWPLMNTTNEPFTGDTSRAGPWGMNGALIKATVNEIRFLARAYRATDDERFRTSLLRGLNFITSAQYPTGGWPHSVPPRMSDYSHYATFNDDLMADVMTLLREVAEQEDFAVLDTADRQDAAASFQSGLEFILNTQIIVDGKRTAWAQQHDEITLEPRPARPFEPVAISAGESAPVLALLMSIVEPSSDIRESIEAAVQWYRDVQIDGYRLIQTREDRVLESDSEAPALWARFYEIGTNRPIFAGRDGVVKYAMAEIEQERRSGYAWYNRNGSRVFELYSQWPYSSQ